MRAKTDWHFGKNAKKKVIKFFDSCSEFSNKKSALSLMHICDIL